MNNAISIITKQIKKLIFVTSIGIFLVACNQSKEITETKDIGNLTQKVVLTDTHNEGYTLMKNNCYVCHNPNAKSHDSIIAPPFAAVKRRYSMQYNNKEEFVDAVIDWALNPNEDKALMRGAVREFKVMPKLFLEKNELEKIATYLYENEVEQPEWFAAHFNEMHGQGQGMRMGMGKGRRMNKKNK
ncbi:MAG: c-type cytochrome [Flavobacteriaceae bacterium]|nr:c-type cytochrome [Flavobacteriaceae bacterium]